VQYSSKSLIKTDDIIDEYQNVANINYRLTFQDASTLCCYKPIDLSDRLHNQSNSSNQAEILIREKGDECLSDQGQADVIFKVARHIGCLCKSKTKSLEEIKREGQTIVETSASLHA
jgi:hypothetical protein